jgi:hypothetical protein
LYPAAWFLGLAIAMLPLMASAAAAQEQLTGKPLSDKMGNWGITPG